MTLTEQEILSQPDWWRQALERASFSVGRWRRFLEHPVAFVGAGSSYYVGLAAAAYAEEHLETQARAVPASLYTPRTGEVAVFISRSGTTTEVLEAAQRARQAGTPSAALVCDAATPLAELVDEPVRLEFVKERSVVQTGSATSAMLFLRAVVDALVGRPAPSFVLDQIGTALSRPLPCEGVEHVVVLGSGWRYGVACEAALKAQETARLWAERYVPMEYRHGPVTCADEATLVLVLDPRTPQIEALARDVAATGAKVVVAEFDPLVELVRVQKLAVSISLRKGLDPDNPQYLRRSITLGSELPFRSA